MDGEEEDAFGGDVRQVCRYPEELRRSSVHNGAGGSNGRVAN